MNEINEIEKITNEMNLARDIKSICDLLNSIDTYESNSLNYLSIVDKKIDFWEHVIELDKLNITQIYRVYKEIKKLRLIRRKIKNDIEILDVFKRHRQKLSYPASVDGITIEIFKCDTKQKNRKYSYSEYSQEELNKILGVEASNSEEIKESE